MTRIDDILELLRRSIRGMEEPAVEKISEDSLEDPFQVLISTMLSAQTRDPVTHAASMRLFKVARTPRTMAELLTLPGVGRKTANLVLILSHASKDNICVDTHVHRISNRLGWVTTRTPEQTEQALYRVVPRRWWPDVNLFLVTWGQNVCRPVYPLCPACVLGSRCPRIGVGRVGRGQPRT